ncbi:proline-serine-threonine phosphatase interacting protein [Mactra antiquata]
MGATFEDSFWETDFNGTLGFDVLNRRMKDGQKVCHDIIEFFKKRAKADQQYGKTLRNIARAAEDNEDGDLGVSWKTALTHTVKTAILHENSAMHYTRLVDDLTKYAEGAKVEIKQIEEKMKERLKTKKITHGKMTECKRTYIDKCRESQNLEEQYESAKMAVTTTVKELEKLRVKTEKSRENMEKADTAYKQSVDTLEHARVHWIADMEDCCRNFQSLEEERIYIIRDELWKCSNIDSQLCVDWDESCESIRRCLEVCDVQNEIRNFIRTNMTGKIRPGRIEYENYFTDQNTNSSSLPRSKGLRALEAQTENRNSYTSTPFITTHLLPAIHLLPTERSAVRNSSPPSPRSPPVPVPRTSRGFMSDSYSPCSSRKYPHSSTYQDVDEDDEYSVIH